MVLRKKGGPDAAQLRQGKNFAITRLNNQEFKACVTARKQLMQSIFPIKHLSDYSYTGALNGLCKSIQKDDTINPLGKRSVLFSQSGFKLEGFSLNRIHPFEQYIKHPLQYTIDKATASAVVELPAIIPGINFTNPNQRPLCRFVFVLGGVADIVFDETRNEYVPVSPAIFPVIKQTAWYNWKENVAAQTIRLSFDENLSTSALNPIPSSLNLTPYTLLLSAGIEFGMPLSTTEVKVMKGDGAGKMVMLR